MDLSARQFAAGLIIITLFGVGLRLIFQPADPPTHAPVGITWHDEGVWVHNARNRAMFGDWRLDAWNPMFVSPVFTGLEYAAFRLFGVGTFQARLVSVATGTVSVMLLGLAVARLGGYRSGLLAAALLSTSYVYVMYNRVALLETTMIMFLVLSWYAHVRAQRSPAWGIVAATCAMLAFLSKASAAFFLLAIGLEGLWSALARQPVEPKVRAAARFTLVGLIVAGLAAIVVFIGPNWTEYRFYNLEVYGARRSSIGLGPLLDRASWFPIIHDFFTRSWAVTILTACACLGLFARWRQTSSPERLLWLWVVCGVIELIVHDLGNERRFVFLIPAMAAFAALILGRDRQLLPSEVARLARARALLAAPVVLFVGYVISGALLRLPFLYVTRPSVRLAAAAALVGTGLIYVTWPRTAQWLSSRWQPHLSVVLASVIVLGDLAQFAQWAAGRTYKNSVASQQLRVLLPKGTLVQGKLANGLALENEILPLFIGPGFGNYADRYQRRDVRYVLTYIRPRLGYEGSVIVEVLEANPGWRIVKTFEVAETAGGSDLAALIEKPFAPSSALPK